MFSFKKQENSVHSWLKHPMQSKSTYILFSSFVLCAIFGHGAAEPSVQCARASRPCRATVRHIEGKGIGYSQGYTSLDLFFSHLYGNSLPFLDLRGHVFDDARFAANAGVGYRHLHGDYIFGGSLSYDYRNTNVFHYNQISAGFEVLGARWDFRINGYLPVGAKQSGWRNNSFYGFSGHYLLIKREEEFSLKGLNAEAGLYSEEKKSLWFYGGIGPYYYGGKGENAYGGRIRLNGNYKSYVSLELSGSYDNVFHDIFQAQLSFSVPFGPRSRAKRGSSPNDCSSWAFLKERIVQPVVKDEIIATNTRRKKFLAIDPSGGAPYYFIFVDNTSSSDGTYESPYPTLDQAIAASSPGNIIYIFPGDGTSTGLTTDSGYQLLDGQQLLGSGYSYTFATAIGPVQVPSLAGGQPHLVALDDADTLIIPGNGNTIVGLQLEADGDDANCIGTDNPITDLTVIDNLLEPLGSNESSTAIYSSSAAGTFLIQGNTVNSEGVGSNNIYIGSSGPLAALVTDNAFNATYTSIQAGNPGDSICLRFQNNSSSAGEDAYFFSSNTDAPFNLEPFTGNTPDSYQSAGTITSVAQDTCN